VIFVDTNILIDVIAPDQPWRDWSLDRIERLGGEQPLVIDQIVLAELASGFPTLDEANEWLARLGVEIRLLDEAAAFVAGQAFRVYRQTQKDRSSVLSDFLIGGHAQALGAALLTRDRAIYERYFPDLPLITPETDNG
jgi:predicted nucleic acid-binding protein